MIVNYFKTAIRNLWRRKAFSLINILGLAVGLTAGFLIFLYVSFEHSYDNFHTKGDRIYRLVTDIKTPSETIHAPITSWPFAPNIKSDFPEVESFVRVNRTNLLMRKGDIKFQEDKALLADSTFFRIFDFKLIEGDAGKVLNAPFNIVLSQSAARRYFGNAKAEGQTIIVNDGELGVVTGVMEDIPENSQFKADVLLSMTTQTEHYNPHQDEEWSNFDASTFLLLKPGTDPKALQAKFPNFLERHEGKEMKENQMFFTLFLEPLKEIYLGSTRGGYAQGNAANLKIFSLIALFIILIACINFVNLATSRSVERAKEVGIRKVVGAGKEQLIWQYLGESLVVTLVAFFLTLVLVYSLLPMFNHLAGKTIRTNLFEKPKDVVSLLLTAILIGVAAGLYPAFVLSSFKPITVLKGKFSSHKSGIVLRKALVVTQFTISIALIIGTIIVYNQMKYMRSQELGFDKDQMMVIDTYGDANREALKQEISSLPMVKSTSLSSSVPGASHSTAYSEVENSKGDMQITNLDSYFVDFDFIPQFKIPIVAGRAFARDFGTDTTQAMVVNESAVKLLGYSSALQIIEKKFSQWGRSGKIIGVIKDFHFHALQDPIKPMCMRIEPERTNLLSIKIAGAQSPQALAAIEGKWKTLIPQKPFSYYFLDEFFDNQYRGEERFGSLFLNFAILAIFLSCLGLLGLASYSTIQRTKEIGIRKVIGASTTDIVNLLTKNFLQLVTIAFVVAVPFAWYFMDKWLQDFAYRTNIQWWVFFAAGILALLIAFLTISILAVKAAIANPVKSLRSE